VLFYTENGFTFHFFAIYLWQKHEFDLFYALFEQYEVLNICKDLFIKDLISIMT